MSPATLCIVVQIRQRAAQQSLFYNNKLRFSDLTTNRVVGDPKQHSAKVAFAQCRVVIGGNKRHSAGGWPVMLPNDKKALLGVYTFETSGFLLRMCLRAAWLEGRI